MAKKTHTTNSITSLAFIKTQKLEVPQILTSLNLSIQDTKAISGIISRTKQLSKVVRDPNKPSGIFVLFTGEGNSDKLSVAAHMANSLDSEIYRIDLAALVNKYIGETEKNLNRLFEKAKNKNWILYFDEADALFGKRTGVKNSHDKYANIEVSYLLQKMEEHTGLALLASNNKSNIDEAFLKRFQNIIHFPLPKPEQRGSIWDKLLHMIKSLFQKKAYVVVTDVDGS